MWAVYDGHGGAEVSSYLGRELHLRLQHQLCSGLAAAPQPQQPTPECREDACTQRYHQDTKSGQDCGVAAALRQAFADVDAEIMAATTAIERAASGGGPSALAADVEGGSSAPAAWDVGSTAVVAVVQWDRVARGGVPVPGGAGDTTEGTTRGGGAGEAGLNATAGLGQAAPSFRGGTLWVANLGNSRAVMCVRPGEVPYAASASGAPSPVEPATGPGAVRSSDLTPGMKGPNSTVAAGDGLGSSRNVGAGSLRTAGGAGGTAESAVERAARRRRAREAGGVGGRAQAASGPWQGAEEGHVRLLAVDLGRVHEMGDAGELRRVAEAGGGPPPTRPGATVPWSCNIRVSLYLLSRTHTGTLRSSACAPCRGAQVRKNLHAICIPCPVAGASSYRTCMLYRHALLRRPCLPQKPAYPACPLGAKPRLAGDLEVTRALGDLQYRPMGLSPLPELAGPWRLGRLQHAAHMQHGTEGTEDDSVTGDGEPVGENGGGDRRGGGRDITVDGGGEAGTDGSSGLVLLLVSDGVTEAMALQVRLGQKEHGVVYVPV